MKLAVALCASTFAPWPQLSQAGVGFRVLVILVTISVSGLGYSNDTMIWVRQKTVARIN
jgi:hypothetical protein